MMPQQRLLVELLVQQPSALRGLIIEYAKDLQRDLRLLAISLGVAAAVDIREATRFYNVIADHEDIINGELFGQHVKVRGESVEQAMCAPRELIPVGNYVVGRQTVVQNL